jgi:hypothetical protein
LGSVRFFELNAGPAVCRSKSADRSSAARLLVGRLPVPDFPLADVSAVTRPGRVHGLGRFESAAIQATLAQALPSALRNSLRAHFEWYACRGAFFHNDAHYGDVLFGAWCVAGPSREIVFSRAGLRVPAVAGNWVVFDPFEPHAVLDPGADRYSADEYRGTPASLFIGFELALDPAVGAAFGIGAAPAGGRLLSSSIAINAETGTAD